MSIEDIIHSPEGRTLEFKQEIPKKLENILRTVVLIFGLAQQTGLLTHGFWLIYAGKPITAVWMKRWNPDSDVRSSPNRLCPDICIGVD